MGKIHWRRDRLPTPVFLGFPGGSAGKESACDVGDLGSTPGLGRSPREGKGYPCQFSGLENSMDSIVCGVAELDTTEQLSLSLHFPSLSVISKYLNASLFPVHIYLGKQPQVASKKSKSKIYIISYW